MVTRQVFVRSLGSCGVYRLSKATPEVWKSFPSFKHCIKLSLCGHRNYGSYHYTEQLVSAEHHLEVQVSTSEEKLCLNYVWLRDHCRCTKCYNHVTNQRSLNLLDVPSDITPGTCNVVDDSLCITWPDGHVSTYSLEWLQGNSYPGALNKKKNATVLWNKESIQSMDIAKVDVDDFMNTEEGLKCLLTSLIAFGVGIVQKVPISMAGTRTVVERVAQVQRTLFGDMWEFSDEMVHSDTAYTKQALGAHTDNTYFTEAAGLQVFHCLHHDGTGGETLLVDGFQAANKLRVSHPDSFQRLCNIPLEAEYLETGHHHCHAASVLRMDPVTDHLQQIRFNLYDRAPFSNLPVDQVASYYKDLRRLALQIRDPCGEWWLKLCPGMVLFINNWRVLHGRAAYTGHRRMGGCYVGRGDFLSQARVVRAL